MAVGCWPLRLGVRGGAAKEVVGKTYAQGPSAADSLGLGLCVTLEGPRLAREIYQVRGKPPTPKSPVCYLVMEQLTSYRAISALLGSLGSRTGKVVLQSLLPFLELVFLLRSRKVVDYCVRLWAA